MNFKYSAFIKQHLYNPSWVLNPEKIYTRVFTMFYNTHHMEYVEGKTDFSVHCYSGKCFFFPILAILEIKNKWLYEFKLVYNKTLWSVLISCFLWTWGNERRTSCKWLKRSNTLHNTRSSAHATQSCATEASSCSSPAGVCCRNCFTLDKQKLQISRPCPPSKRRGWRASLWACTEESKHHQHPPPPLAAAGGAFHHNIQDTRTGKH